MFRWIVNDTRALIADLRALRRQLVTRWQWMRLRSRQRAGAAAAGLENVRRSAAVRTRMCSACRALIPVDARACPECGEAPGQPVSRGMSRVIENMIPGALSVTSALLTLNMVFYGVSLLVDSQLAGGALPPPVRADAWQVALVALGANVPLLVSEGESWRLITYMFLHYNLIHLLFNSYALLTVGPLLEEIYGSPRYLFVYLLTGVGGGLASAFWRAGSWVPGEGASGAIFGLIGLAAVWGWRRGGSVGEGIRAQMAQWALYGLVMGFVFSFDNAAHLGGLLSGALLGLVLDDVRMVRRGSGALWSAGAAMCCLIVLASFVMVGVRYQETLARIVGAF